MTKLSISVNGIVRTKIVKKVGRFFKPHYIKAKFSKNLPNQDLETQHIISFKNFLLSQTQVSFGDCYGAMIEQFH